MYSALEQNGEREQIFVIGVLISLLKFCRKAYNSVEINSDGGGSWIESAVEDIGVDKIYLGSAFIVGLCRKP